MCRHCNYVYLQEAYRAKKQDALMEELHIETVKENVGRVHAEPGTKGKSVKHRLRVREIDLWFCHCFSCLSHGLFC